MAWRESSTPCVSSLLDMCLHSIYAHIVCAPRLAPRLIDIVKLAAGSREHLGELRGNARAVLARDLDQQRVTVACWVAECRHRRLHAVRDGRRESPRRKASRRSNDWQSTEAPHRSTQHRQHGSGKTRRSRCGVEASDVVSPRVVMTNWMCSSSDRHSATRPTHAHARETAVPLPATDTSSWIAIRDAPSVQRRGGDWRLEKTLRNDRRPLWTQRSVAL